MDNKLIQKDDEMLNDEEIKYLKSKVLFNYKEKYINTIKRYLNKINFNYKIDDLKNSLKNINLNKEVENVVDAINLINSNNLFTHLGLKEYKKKREKLDIPLNIKYTLRIIEKDDNSLNTNMFNNKNIKLELNNNICEIYEVIESTYKIQYVNKEKEWNISIYFNKNDDEKIIIFNFIEVYSILTNKSLKDSIIELIELLNIKVKNINEYLESHYINLKQLSTENLVQYQYFYKIAKNKITLLEKMIRFAIKECYFSTNVNEIKDVYLSNRYLAKEVGKAYSTITPYVNTFALMGFYKKNIINNLKQYNDTTSYKMNYINNDILTNANLIAKKMIDDNISFSKVTYKYIKDNYGVNVAKSIILDKNIKSKGDGICA